MVRFGEMHRVWTREDLLWVPPTFATFSLLYTCSIALRGYFVPNEKVSKTSLPLSEGDDGRANVAKRTSLGDAVKALDGSFILSYRLLRLLSVFCLLSLEVYETSIGHEPRARTLQIAFYVRVVFLDEKIPRLF